MNGNPSKTLNSGWKCVELDNRVTILSFVEKSSLMAIVPLPSQQKTLH